MNINLEGYFMSRVSDRGRNLDNVMCFTDCIRSHALIPPDKNILYYSKEIDTNTSFLVPKFIASSVITNIEKNSGNHIIVTKFLLSERNNMVYRKTSSSIFTQMFRCSSRSLTMAKLSSGDTYWGNRYMILKEVDGHFYPLMVLCDEIEPGERCLLYGNNIVQIYGEVFRKEEMISKYILKEVMPFYVRSGVEVRITDRNNFSKIPSNYHANTESAYHCLSHVQ